VSPAAALRVLCGAAGLWAPALAVIADCATSGVAPVGFDLPSDAVQGDAVAVAPAAAAALRSMLAALRACARAAAVLVLPVTPVETAAADDVLASVAARAAAVAALAADTTLSPVLGQAAPAWTGCAAGAAQLAGSVVAAAVATGGVTAAAAVLRQAASLAQGAGHAGAAMMRCMGGLVGAALRAHGLSGDAVASALVSVPGASLPYA
jgi:hypothetical protein